MTFATPDALGIFVVVAALAAALLAFGRWRVRARQAFGGPASRAWGGRTFGLRLLLVAVGAGFLALAIARPQWGHSEVVQERQGVDLVVALDISESMQAADVEPSRLAYAQSELSRLVESLIGSRVGLVIFAGDAVLRSPLTTDVHSVADLIRRSDREVGLTRAGSNLSRALTQADRILAASKNPGKAVLVVSDGEDHVGTGAQGAAALAEKGIVVLTAGVGTPGGSVIMETGADGNLTVKLDANGQPVITRLDAAELIGVAEAGGGRYFAVGQPGDLQVVKGVLDRLEQSPLGEETQVIPIERFQIFAAIAFVLLFLAWVTPDDLRLPRLPRAALRHARAPAVLLLAVLLGAGCGGAHDTVRERNADANDLYDAGQFDQALTDYQALQTERPDLPEIAYNAGNTLDRLGEYERAIEETSRALPHQTTDLGAATYYALGNHYYALGRLEEAYRAYRSALLLKPDDQDAKYNLELTLLRIQQAEDEPSTPAPGQPEPGPGDQPSNPDAPPPDQGAPSGQPSPDQTPPPADQPSQETQQEQITNQLQDALQGLGDDVSVEDAIRILNLLQELQRTQSTGSPTGGGSGPDY